MILWPGDAGCRRDKDGYYWITGRIDDMLNVSGKTSPDDGGGCRSAPAGSDVVSNYSC